MRKKNKFLLGALVTSIAGVSLSTVIVQNSKTHNNFQENQLNNGQKDLINKIGKNENVLSISTEQRNLYETKIELAELKITKIEELQNQITELSNEIKENSKKLKDEEDKNKLLISRISDLSKEILNFQKTISDNEKEDKKKREEIQRLNSELDKLNIENNKLKNQNESLLEQKGKLISDIAKKDEEISNLKNQISILTAGSSEKEKLLQEQVTNLEKDKEILNKELEGKNKEINDLRKQLGDYDDNVKKIKDLTNELANSEIRIKELEQEAKDWEKEAKDWKTLKEIIEDEMFEKIEEIKKLQNQLDSTNVENSSLKKELEQKIKDIDEYKKQKEIDDAKIEYLVKKLKSSIESNIELRKDSENKEKIISHLKSQVDYLTNKLKGVVVTNQDLRRELDKKSQLITTLAEIIKKNSDDSTDKINAALKRMKEFINTIADLENKIRKSDEEKEILKKDIEQKKKENDELKNEVSTSKDSIELKEQKIKELSDKLNELNGKNIKLEEEKKALLVEVESYKKVIKEQNDKINKLEDENKQLREEIIRLKASYSSNLLESFDVITISKKDYEKNIKELGLNISYSSLRKSSANNRLFLENLSNKFQYGNLVTLIKNNPNIKIDMSTITFSKWEIDSDYNLKKVSNIDNLIQTMNPIENLRTSLSFDVTDSSSTNPVRKNITLAFNVKNENNSVEQEWNSIYNSIITSSTSRVKARTHQLPYFLINIDKYDEEIGIINSDDSRQLIRKLFNYTKDIPSYYEISHKITKKGPRSNYDQNNSQIYLKGTFNKYGYEIVFDVKAKSPTDNRTVFQQSQSILVALQSNSITQDSNGREMNLVNGIAGSTYGNNAMYSYILYNRINNFRAELGINAYMNETELKKNHLFVSKQSESMIKGKVGSGLSNVKYSEIQPLLRYIFSDFNREDIFKIHDEIGFRYGIEYLTRANTDKGFINSNIGKSFDFNVFNKDVFFNSSYIDEMKVDVRVKYSDMINKPEYTLDDDYNFALDGDRIGTVTIVFKHSSGMQQRLEFTYSTSYDAESYNLVNYLMLNDLVEKANPNKAKYDTKTNTVTIRATRETYKKYYEATKRIINNIKNQDRKDTYEIIKILNGAVDNNNSMKSLGDYSFYAGFRLFNKTKALYWAEKTLKYDSSIKNVRTLFAGGATNINDFGFWINWVIID